MIIAADGPIKMLLQQEFPANTFICLPQYNVRYSSNPGLLIWRLFLQVPGVINTILKENRLLKKIVKEYSIDTIISDNRFGRLPDEVEQREAVQHIDLMHFTGIRWRGE